jgi:flavodoxin
MTIGIIYYSRTGNTKAVAQILAEKLKQKKAAVDLIEIEAVKHPGFLAAGRSAMKQVDLPIKNPDIDLGKYTTLVVGSPTWAGSCSPFIKTFFSSAKNIKGKKTAMFITRGGALDPQGKSRQMMQQNLLNAGVNLSDNFLGLQMKKGKILDGETQIDGFVESLLEK